MASSDCDDVSDAWGTVIILFLVVWGALVLPAAIAGICISSWGIKETAMLAGEKHDEKKKQKE